MKRNNHSIAMGASAWPRLAVGTLLVAAIHAGAAPVPSNGMEDARNQPAKVKRDPFWPVGYEPEGYTASPRQAPVAASAPQGKTGWSEAMKEIVINGVSSRADNEYFAVINGQVLSVGETISVSHGGTIYTWAVDSIQPPGAVKLRRVSAVQGK